jgi:septal ring factor EnvC (AmiA/AmiB activator)
MQVSAKIDEAKAASEAIRSDIAVLNTRLDRIKAAREAEQAKLNEIISAQQEARSDIPALNVEKKELWEVRVVLLLLHVHSAVNAALALVVHTVWAPSVC